MINEGVVKCFNEVSKKYAKKDVKFNILLGQAQKKNLLEFDNEYDARLDDLMYIDNAITIISEFKGDYLYKTTMIFLDQEDMMKCKYFFWKHNKNENVLKKIYIKDIVENNRCCIMGYTQASRNLKERKSVSLKPIMLMFYLDLCTKICKENITLLMEPCGICEFEEESALNKDIFQITNLNVVDSFGKVRLESKVSEKTANILGMRKLNEVYHCTTLGPVYIG